MPTSVANGTQAASIGVEHTLATDTSNNTYVFVCDTNNMANGDILELRIYTICLSAGTERLSYIRRFKHLQAEPIKYSVPVPADISFKATLKQTAGTGRNYPWSILVP